MPKTQIRPLSSAFLDVFKFADLMYIFWRWVWLPNPDSQIVIYHSIVFESAQEKGSKEQWDKLLRVKAIWEQKKVFSARLKIMWERVDPRWSRGLSRQYSTIKLIFSVILNPLRLRHIISECCLILWLIVFHNSVV